MVRGEKQKHNVGKKGDEDDTDSAVDDLCCWTRLGLLKPNIDQYWQ